MTLRLIGAGLPRTGTSSLREALRLLLGAPVYHMSEAFAHPEHAPVWQSALRGEPPEWRRFLAGYAAGVDVPFSLCWSELAATFPDAPVLLSVRTDAHTWLRSMEATVLPRTREMATADEADPMVPLFRVLFDQVFASLDDPDDLVTGYETWNARVRDAVDPARLVVWDPADGWAPICRALELPVPDRTFPHENSTAAHRARHEDRAARDRARRSPGSSTDPARPVADVGGGT